MILRKKKCSLKNEHSALKCLFFFTTKITSALLVKSKMRENSNIEGLKSFKE